MKKNVFVIGDLVVDHTIFVRNKALRPHLQVDPQEQIYEVIRRQLTAGGAANTARILAMVNEGNTFLWGIVGKTPLNSFRSILNGSTDFDNSDRVIEFYGVQDETDAPMHTINRIMTNHDSTFRQPVRFDDYGDIHITTEKHFSVLSTLNHVHKEQDNKIDVIIINDLDFLCITKGIIEPIAKFAKDNNIPLLIDPKRNREKYDNIEATMILPNLYEWCHLINEPDKEKHWRDQLDNNEQLIEMAQRSLYHLGNFRYHIIKCDKDGIIAFIPSPDNENKYSIYRMPAYNTQYAHYQLGCGDLIDGIMAMSIDKNSGSKQVLEALNYANCVVAAYREQSWFKMPSLKDIKEKENTQSPESKKWNHESKGFLTKGITYLPKGVEIKLSKFKTIVPELYTNNRDFRTNIDSLLEDVYKDNAGTIHSIILDGPAGCGKSSLMQYIISENSEESTAFSVDFSNELLSCDLNNLDNYFKELRRNYNLQSGKKLLLIVDEVLKRKKNSKNIKSYIEENGVIILNAAHKQNVCFLLIDATFNEKYRTISTELKSRCKKYALPSLKNRPEDVPVIVAGILKELCKSSAIYDINIEAGVILVFINKLLTAKEFSPREIVNMLTTMFDKAYRQDMKSINIVFEFLPYEYQQSEWRFSPSMTYNVK